MGVGGDQGAGGDRLADELRERKGMLVLLPVPVLETPADALGYQPVDGGGVLPARIHALAREQETPRRAEAGDEGLVSRHGGEDLGQGPVDGAEERQLPDL